MISIRVWILSAVLTVMAPGFHTISTADEYDPPVDYYNTATGTGAALELQLHNIIDNHTVRSYNSARSLLQITDRDPKDPDSILLVYNRASLDVSSLGSSIPGWDSGASWNREHTWPRSRGVDSSGPDNSDLHQLRPSNPSINGSRSNLNFGGAYGQTYGRKSDGGTVWYPGDVDAGMIARQQFYMAVRYDGSDPNTQDLTLVAGNPGGGASLGNLNRLMQWHFQATPDEFERRRNDVVYRYQNNRNPFVDRPEFAWSVFMDQANDSRLYVGGAPASNGGSSVSYDFGRVIVGTAIATNATVTLNKDGQDGLYYEVQTGGGATSDVTGRHNAFAMNATGQRALNVGLNADTNTVGLYSGQVTIDNLDVTTQGGSGRGANDADDTIDLSLAVLDHSNASFLALTDTNTMTYDFGTVTKGTVAMFGFSIHNLGGDFTAGLDYDGMSAIGDTDRFVLSIDEFEALAVGMMSDATVSLRTDTVGDFSTTITLQLSDEDIPGGTGGQELVLNLSGEVVVPEPASLAWITLGMSFLAFRRRQPRS